MLFWTMQFMPTSKTKSALWFDVEIINVTTYPLPTVMQGIERVRCAKLLGVWLQSDLGSRTHVEYVLHICNQRLYLLSQLKKQALTLAKLKTVFDAIVLSRLLYGAPAWSGYAQSIGIVWSTSLEWLCAEYRYWLYPEDAYEGKALANYI